MKRRFDKRKIEPFGFVLNHHLDGGDVIVVPLHGKGCSGSPCKCGATDAMPKNIVNCDIEWKAVQP